MFWISEEADPSMWRPDKIIPCFMACLKRLIYCVEYSTLLHYFIPDNNLFYLRFDVNKRDKIISILKNLFERGIYCFAWSETLCDLMKQDFNATDSSVSRRVASLHEIMDTVITSYHRHFNLLYFNVHHSSSKISRSVFFVMLSCAHQNVPQISEDQQRSNNKQKYHKYKRDLCHLLIGTNSDAVGGWMMLASFFYVHKNYLLSLDIISYALRKCTDEKLYPLQIGLDEDQKNLLRLLKRTELCTLSKSFTVKYLKFNKNSPICPQELQLNRIEQAIPFHPTIFANFLSFLCYYHLPEIKSYKQSLFQLQQTIMQHLTSNRCNSLSGSILLTCLGIAYQMIGKAYQARQYFELTVLLDEHNLTSAAMKLSNCNVY
ncbi:Hypothetical predicted protein [Mytilus galloprovincialis]|uniref:Mab-21-like HhH/H2TH-like domain-containing protein n=1 Tax=Mytilus galloprovincialis TaxID=29158 RepID=A0A8B6DUY9_MYTGA|nr:Hypothetical predicted protein [Mytilus galloprovincialis]